MKRELILIYIYKQAKCLYRQINMVTVLQIQIYVVLLNGKNRIFNKLEDKRYYSTEVN